LVAVLGGSRFARLCLVLAGLRFFRGGLLGVPFGLLLLSGLGVFIGVLYVVFGRLVAARHAQGRHQQQGRKQYSSHGATIFLKGLVGA
jgi:hypothetical protein